MSFTLWDIARNLLLSARWTVLDRRPQGTAQDTADWKCRNP